MHGRPASIGAHPAVAGAGELAQAEAGVHPPGGHGGWQVEKEVAVGGGLLPLPSLTLNHGALLLWWAWASSMDTPGCGCATAPSGCLCATDPSPPHRSVL